MVLEKVWKLRKIPWQAADIEKSSLGSIVISQGYRFLDSADSYIILLVQAADFQYLMAAVIGRRSSSRKMSYRIPNSTI